MSRKIEATHSLFGRTEGQKCRDCCNLDEHEYRGRNYRKCEAYGVSNSQATDWSKFWPACGQFRKPYTGSEVIRLLSKRKAEMPIGADEAILNQGE